MASRKTSPTQRTLAMCKRQGWTVQVVERWCQFSKRRIDLFGIIDVLVADGKNIIGIQVTSGANMAARLTKIRESAQAKAWLESGGRIMVHGWRKLKSSGKWECREQEVFLNEWESAC